MYSVRYLYPTVNRFRCQEFDNRDTYATTHPERGEGTVTDRDIADLEATVGTTKRTVEDFRVEAGKVEEFARAVGDDDPAYRSASAAEARGLPAVPAPPTFPRVSSFPRYRVDAFDLGFDPQFVLHGEQRYEYARRCSLVTTSTARRRSRTSTIGRDDEAGR
nr:MaoC family dehydratase N-terminal domain-containing protein [Halomarina rubra]